MLTKGKDHMSKLLKATIAKHRPHIAARLTEANGYDEAKHIHSGDLHRAGLINDQEKADLDGCVDDLNGDGSALAGALKAIMSGKLPMGKANDDEFIKSLMDLDGQADSDEGEDDGDAVDDLSDSDEEVTA